MLLSLQLDGGAYLCSSPIKRDCSPRPPEGYGDCALESSDGVIFHFPRSLLIHSSTFFKSTLDTVPSTSTQQPKVSIEEKSSLVKLLLVHIDPTMSKPHVTEETIEPLLSLSLKYGVPHIQRWLTECMLTGRVDPVTGQETPALIRSKPLLILHFADKYDLKDVGKQALREVLKWPEDELEEGMESLPRPLEKYIRGVRKERTKRYQEYIDYLVIKATELSCSDCASNRNEQFVNLERVAHERPCWDAFVAAMSWETSPCDDCWMNSLLLYPADWQMECTEVEQALPEWPLSDIPSLRSLDACSKSVSHAFNEYACTP